MSSSSAALHAANSTVELQPDYSAAAAEAGRATLADLLRSTRVYDVMPESCKVVVFDTSIPVRLAFFALLEHGAGFEALWGPRRRLQTSNATVLPHLTPSLTLLPQLPYLDRPLPPLDDIRCSVRAIMGFSNVFICWYAHNVRYCRHHEGLLPPKLDRHVGGHCIIRANNSSLAQLCEKPRPFVSRGDFCP